MSGVVRRGLCPADFVSCGLVMSPYWTLRSPIAEGCLICFPEHSPAWSTAGGSVQGLSASGKPWAGAPMVLAAARSYGSETGCDGNSFLPADLVPAALSCLTVNSASRMWPSARLGQGTCLGLQSLLPCTQSPHIWPSCCWSSRWESNQHVLILWARVLGGPLRSSAGSQPTVPAWSGLSLWPLPRTWAVLPAGP